MKNLNTKMVLISLLLMVFFSQLSLANNYREKVDNYMVAMQKVYQPKASAKDIDALFAFMTDDITDFHAAYGVTLKGTEKKRKGLQQKALDSISYKLTVENIIMVLEFNQQGLIKHMRRYLD